MMKNKKGQVAMEFLMTYGWAILVVLVAIGALAYFGIFNLDKFKPHADRFTCYGMGYENQVINNEDGANLFYCFNLTKHYIDGGLIVADVFIQMENGSLQRQ